MELDRVANRETDPNAWLENSKLSLHNITTSAKDIPTKESTESEAPSDSQNNAGGSVGNGATSNSRNVTESLALPEPQDNWTGIDDPVGKDVKNGNEDGVC